MDMYQSTQKSMDRIVGTDHLAWPDENVVRVLRRSFPEGITPGMRALDIGFGSGRHLRLLAEEGFEISGLDYADNAHDMTSKMLKSYGWKADLRREELSQTSFKPDSFDFVVAWGVLFLKPIAEIQEDLLRVYQLMKPGGVLCTNFRTTNNWFFQLGAEQCPNGYLLDERAGDYRGCFYQFLDEPELTQMISETPFQLVGLSRVDWMNFQSLQHSWWITQLRM